MLMKRNKHGFTLIEVILVLAVGSLIFMMAFLAFSRASVNRRDSARRADLAKISGALEDYAADNNGKYPELVDFGGNLAKNISEYIGDLSDPSGTKYADIGTGVGLITYAPQKNWSGNYKDDTMCDGSAFPGGNRDYVIRMKLEKGEACRDSRQ